MVMGKVEQEVNTIMPRQNTGRANKIQFTPQMKGAEQNLSLPCMAPWSKPVFRHEEWKQAGFINVKKQNLHDLSKKEEFQRRALAGQDTICRFERTLWLYTPRLRCLLRTLKFTSLQIWSYQISTLNSRCAYGYKYLLSHESSSFLRAAHHASLCIIALRTTLPWPQQKRVVYSSSHLLEEPLLFLQNMLLPRYWES